MAYMLFLDAADFLMKQAEMQCRLMGSRDIA